MTQRDGGSRVARKGIGMVCGLAALLVLNSVVHTGPSHDFVWFTVGRILGLAGTALVMLGPVANGRWRPSCCILVVATACAICLGLRMLPITAGDAGTLLLLGACIASLTAVWFTLCAQWSYGWAVAWSLGALAISALGRKLLVKMAVGSPGWSDALLIVLLGISTVLALNLWGQRDAAPIPVTRATPSKPKRPRISMLGVMAEFAAYGIVYGVLYALNAEHAFANWVQSSGFLIQAIIPTILLGAIGLAKIKPLLGTLTHGAILLGTLVILGIVILGRSQHVVGELAMIAFPAVVASLVYLRLFAVVKELDLQPGPTFCTVQIAYRLAILAGLACGTLCGQTEAINAIAPEISGVAVGCFLLLATSNLSIPRTDCKHLEQNERPKNSEGNLPLSDDEVFAEQCRTVASRKNLTARELEVMRLTALGLSKKLIANELGIAEDTVRYYLRNVYSKLDVHNKQELLLTVMGQSAEETV